MRIRMCRMRITGIGTRPGGAVETNTAERVVL